MTLREIEDRFCDSKGTIYLKAIVFCDDDDVFRGYICNRFPEESVVVLRTNARVFAIPLCKIKYIEFGSEITGEDT